MAGAAVVATEPSRAIWLTASAAQAIRYPARELQASERRWRLEQLAHPETRARREEEAAGAAAHD